MAVSATTTNNRFHNMSEALLADAIGGLDAEIKALEAEKEAARAALKARGLNRADGERFTVAFVSAIRQSLDVAAVKAEMGQAWFDDRSKLAEVVSMRITVNRAALAAA